MERNANPGGGARKTLVNISWNYFTLLYHYSGTLVHNTTTDGVLLYSVSSGPRDF